MLEPLLVLLSAYFLLLSARDIHHVCEKVDDKVMKTEWDRAGGGAPIVVGAKATANFIPMNCWLKRVNLPGRVAFKRLLCSRGRASQTGHEEGSREPLRFYVQIMDEEDLAMLSIPPKFMQEMKEWLTVKLPSMLRLSMNKWCEFWFQVQNFKGRMVLGTGSEYFCLRHKVIPDDLVMIRISSLWFKVQIYNHKSSIKCRVTSAGTTTSVTLLPPSELVSMNL
ncbi:Protein TOC75, chloroplastic [Hordeum vulgare]|nr:Protein TOC75, chloroplastic [Hordeum vulgare]